MKMILVGIGSLGSRLGKYISNIYSVKSTFIDKDSFKDGLINPSIRDMRYYTFTIKERLVDDLRSFDTVLFIADLSEKVSIASLPLLSLFAKEYDKEVYTISTMPYRFEYSRLYEAKMALDHLDKCSDCIIIVDKDAILTNNPDLRLEDANKMVDDTIINVSKLLLTRMLEFKDNIVALSNKSDINDAFKDLIKMLYSTSDPDDVKEAILYISARESKLREIEDISRHMKNILANASISISFANQNGLLLLASSTNKFERYDPLSKIRHRMDNDLENVMRIGDLGLIDMEL